MNICWFERAVQSLQEIVAFIALDNPHAAYETALRIKTAADILADHPHIGRQGRVKNTRELVVAGTPYILPYRIVGGEIQVLHVLHGARKWPDTFKDKQ